MADDLAIGGGILYPRTLRALCDTPWAILPSKLDAIIDLLASRAAGQRIDPEEVQAIAGAARRETAGRQGSVAIIPIMGTLVQRAGPVSESSGLAGTDRIGAQFREAVADPSISAILLRVDSPGGSVFGVTELAAEIAAARGGKPIVAVADTMAASAAYWLASQADELVVSPSSLVGAIGVYTMHTDLSAALEQMGIKTTYVSAGKYKAEAPPEQPLSAEAQAAIQGTVNHFYGLFVRDVARGRGVAPSAVRGGMGEGRVLTTPEAVAQGMADRVDTFDATLARLQSGAYRKPRRAAAADQTVIDIRGVEAETDTVNVAEGTIVYGFSNLPTETDSVETEAEADTPPDPVPPDTDLRRRRLRRQEALTRR